MKTQIFASQNAIYLDSVIPSLPSKCLFDKGKVGCGGTTLAITNGDNYVIAVPFLSLIENKTQQHPELFGFHGKVKVSDLKNYLDEKRDAYKIITTYDSLPKVISKIDTSKFKLLVDEYHLLFLQYSFRDKAIDGVLKNYHKFFDYTFMTATPLEDEFILEEIKHLDVVECVWPNQIRVNVKLVHCDSGVLPTVVDMTRNFLNNLLEGNAYFFVNSTEFIKDVLKNIPELTSENCNLIYGTSSSAVFDIGRGTLPCHKDGRIAPKKINFLTSTVFEGADIYDENARTIVVSDPSKAQTFLDVSTTINQIIGRARNSKYNAEVTHLFKETRYESVSTFEDLQKLINETTELTLDRIKAFNMFNLKDRKILYNKGVLVFESYLSVDENYNYIFNHNKIKVDMFQYKLSKGIYSLRVNLSREYQKENDVSEFLYETKTQVVREAKISNSFEKAVERLKEIQEETAQDMFNTEFIFDLVLQSEVHAIYRKYPFLKQVYKQFGYEGIKQMNFNQTNIKRKLISDSDDFKGYKVFKMLKNLGYKLGMKIEVAKVKNDLQKIYNELGIDRVAKATDLMFFYEVKQSSIRKDKKIVGCFNVLTPKLFELNK